jgi:glycine oxidase
MFTNGVPKPDILVAGAGIIGLALALELHARGAQVTVLERDTAVSHASTAAAGMLAVHDPHNPAALYPLSHLSAALYPAFLARIAELSGETVPFQTELTMQQETGKPRNPTRHLLPWDLDRMLPGNALHHLHFDLINEHSIDPRQLAHALLAAVRNTTIDLREHTTVRRVVDRLRSVKVKIANDPHVHEAGAFVDCRGSWSPLATPRKGQMLAVEIPEGMDLALVVRTKDIYIVPRTRGPHAGRAIIGATIEDAGFDTTVHQSDIEALHARAAALLPQLANARILESWAGLRPGTPDDLPLIGAAIPDRLSFIASGHFRNGILLAPATAQIIADLIENKPAAVSLDPFSPLRFTSHT